jgi:hypothetical protein
MTRRMRGPSTARKYFLCSKTNGNNGSCCSCSYRTMLILLFGIATVIMTSGCPSCVADAAFVADGTTAAPRFTRPAIPVSAAAKIHPYRRQHHFSFCRSQRALRVGQTAAAAKVVSAAAGGNSHHHANGEDGRVIRAWRRIAGAVSQTANARTAMSSAIRSDKDRRRVQLQTLLRVGIPSVAAGCGAGLAFPALSLSLATAFSDPGVFAVLSQDSSQFVQNFLTVAGLLFSILVGQTCECTLSFSFLFLCRLSRY